VGAAHYQSNPISYTETIGPAQTPFTLRQACPEHAVHPSTGSGRTKSRRAQGEWRKS
jgi:hypothetical protein